MTTTQPSAIAYHNPSYHQGQHDGFEASDAILQAIERLTGTEFLDESYTCQSCEISAETADAVIEAHDENSPCCGHLGFVRPEQGTNPSVTLWESDPDNTVPAYLAQHFSAQEGDTLHWGAGSLTYNNGAWR